MIVKRNQKWAIGQVVKVGFMANLIVLAAVATPGDYLPDEYLLTRDGKFYAFVPHNGVYRISDAEAQEMICTSHKQSEQAALDAAAAATRAISMAQMTAALVTVRG